MANILTSTSLDVFLPEVWSESILKYFEEKLVLRKLVDDYSPLIRNYGDVINVPTLAEMSVATKGAGTALTWTAGGTEGSHTITIDQHKYVGKLFEDIAVIQSQEQLFNKYTQAMGYALAKDVDAYIEAKLRTLVTSQALAADDAMTNGEIESALATLGEADIDFTSGDVFFVVNPTLYADLLANDRFIRYDSLGNVPVPISTGLIGHIYGMPVFMSDAIAKGGTSTTSCGYMFHRSAIGLAVQSDIRVQEQYDVDYLGTKVVADILYGASSFDATGEVRGIRFKNT